MSNSALRFTVAIGTAGIAHTRGTIRLDEGGRPRILVAARGDTQATCADTDDDDVAGLVRMEATFRDIRTGDRVQVVVVPTGPDIDETGVHEMILEIVGEGPVTGQAFIRVRQGRPARKRRS